ncbi:MAG: ABC transporter permease [Ruminococcaceae bacterium]|nr:ABC transporter permease [Oscillospiraceae bacterium]MBQ3215533.1 ABC transporter permease [Oscillospiraceae bacterium]
MGRYLLGRIARGLLSVIIVSGIVMALTYACMDRNLIFAQDPVYSRQRGNARQVYQMQQWENYGYVDYVSFEDYLSKEGLEPLPLGDSPEEDSSATAEQVARFTAAYEAEGYTVTRLNARTRGQKYQEGGEPRLFASRDVPFLPRFWKWLTGLIVVDNIHAAKGEVGQRGISFTWFDPAYGGERFSPAIMGNGTHHKYLLYFDGRFPYIHQNLITLRLGQSYSVNQGVDVFETMTDSQGKRQPEEIVYPSGLEALSADDLHSATYVQGSLAAGDAVVKAHFTDDYTNVTTRKQGLSKLGYSFTIGLLSVGLAYCIGIPVGLWMARKKGRLADRLGTAYVVGIIAVPTLAYIFLFRSIGQRLGLPTAFDVDAPTLWMYVLPVVSLGLPAAANLMKWLRRYTIDQMDENYVRFARSCGLVEGKIFRSHVLKNAAIPIYHGLPASVLGALVGAIITERVYVVPGAGGLLTDAIGAYDNGVIVGLTLFYAVISVAAVILGDLIVAAVDPRIRLSDTRR